MTKTAKNTASSKTSAKASKTREEMLTELSAFLFHTCEIVGGRNFPIGEKFDCVKVGVSGYGKPYTVLSVNGEDKFCDPKNLKPLKALTDAKAAAAKAAQDEAREATLIVSGTIKNESEKAVLLQHHMWFKPRWFPKSLITLLGDHEDGEQKLYEVPRWKVQADHGPMGVAALEDLPEGFEEMLAEAEKPKAIVGKTSLIKRK